MSELQTPPYNLSTYSSQPRELQLYNVFVAYAIHDVPMKDIDDTLGKVKHAVNDVDMALRRMTNRTVVNGTLINEFRKMLRSREYDRFRNLRNFRPQLIRIVRMYSLYGGIVTTQEMNEFDKQHGYA